MAKNPLFTLKTSDWVTTNPFSRDTRGVNPWSHFSFTIEKLHTFSLSDIYIQTLPSYHHYSTDSSIKQVTTNKFLLMVTLIVLLDVSLFVLVKSKVVMGLVSQMMRVLG